MRLIPAIDLRGGRCVRLLHGDFSAETHYPTTAEELYARYASAGAAWLHIVDLDGARDGTPRQLLAIRELAGCGPVRLQVGGGLRDRAAIGHAFEAGATRVVVGSRALSDPAQVAGWIAEFGGDVVALALDVRIGADGEPHLATHGWREPSTSTLWQALAPFARSGLQHVLCTDIGRDGALAGPNCELYREAVQRHPEFEWQASGGIRDVRDLWALRDTGVAAAVSGRALLENLVSAEEMQPFLPAA